MGQDSQSSSQPGLPQLENGHTQIANELLEAIIRFDFSKREIKIVLFVIRKTYGYHKKSDDMSLSQILTGTGLDRSNVSKAISDLVNRKVLLKQPGKYAQVLMLNKKYGDWKGLSKQPPVVKSTTKGWSKQPITVVKTTTTKETTKENTKRKEIFDLPEWVPEAEWNVFVDFRKGIKKPLSLQAKQLAVKKLKEIVEAGDDAAAVINESILRNWLTFYPLKAKSSQPTHDIMAGVT